MKSLWTDIKNLLIETFFGKDRWGELKKQAEESGDSIPTILWEGFLKSINTLYNKVKAKIQEKIIQPIKDKYGDIKQSGKDLINGLLSGIKEKWENIKTRANEIWETIKKPFAKAWDDAYEWGKNLISGLWDGMENTWKWVKREWDDIVDYVKENPVVEWLLGSPSKLFEQYGANLMKGLEIGISDSGSDALKSLDDVVQKISDIDLSTKMNIDPTISDTAGQITSMKDSQISMQSQLAMQTATPASTTINRNFYVQPGQMIATRGEVRNFVRMLREYDKFEEER